MLTQIIHTMGNELGIPVKVGKMPGNIQAIVLEPGKTTVADALALAGLSADGYELRVGGQPASLDMTLQAGDNVLLLKKIQGNA